MHHFKVLQLPLPIQLDARRCSGGQHRVEPDRQAIAIAGRLTQRDRLGSGSGAGHADNITASRIVSSQCQSSGSCLWGRGLDHLHAVDLEAAVGLSFKRIERGPVLSVRALDDDLLDNAGSIGRSL